MGMLSRNYSRVRVERHESALRDAERIPHEIESELTRLSVPSESRTPRGELPSRALQNTINKLRRGATRPFRVLYEVLAFRVGRGEPSHQVTAPLHLLAAKISGPSDGDDTELGALDIEAEAQSTIARERYRMQPTTANLRHWQECEAIEAGITSRIMAIELPPGMLRS